MISGPIETIDEVLELKSAVWACAHLGTSESGVALLESAQVIEALVRMASHSPILALRGTSFFALNLIAMTSIGVDLLARHGNCISPLFFFFFTNLILFIYQLEFIHGFLSGWASIKRHHGELWHIVDESEWHCLHIKPDSEFKHVIKDNNKLDVRNRMRTVSQSSCHSVTFAADERADVLSVVTSTPRQPTSVAPGGCCWETDSQPYSLEGSSINFDSDSDQSTGLPAGGGSVDRNYRRAYTLPLSVQTPGQEYVPHFRSFSDSHYPAADDSASLEVTSSPTSRPKRESRIWNKLRTSLRLRKSKRFSLPTGSPVSAHPLKSPDSVKPIVLVRSEPMNGSAAAEEALSSSTAEDEESSDDEYGDVKEEFDSSSLRYEYQLNRIGSILSRLKSVPYKKRLVSSSARSSCFIGLCLPVQLSYIHPPSSWFEGHVDPYISTILHEVTTMTLNEELQVDHDVDQCIICSKEPSIVSQRETSNV